MISVHSYLEVVSFTSSVTADDAPPTTYPLLVYSGNDLPKLTIFSLCGGFRLYTDTTQTIKEIRDEIGVG